MLGAYISRVVISSSWTDPYNFNFLISDTEAMFKFPDYFITSHQSIYLVGNVKNKWVNKFHSPIHPH